MIFFEEGVDDGYENDDEDFVGFVRDIMDCFYSVQFENDFLKFYNYFKVLYKFIFEEDSFRMEVKFIFGFIDCLKLFNELKYIFCVLYIRKNLDKIV